jgi:magnesium-transporting ATPase (P-type)
MNALYYGSFVSGFGSLGVIVLLGFALSGRSDADRSTKRSYALYLSSVLFIMIFALLGVITFAFVPFATRIGKDKFSYQSPIHDAFKTLLILVIVAIPVIGAFSTHWRWRAALRAEPGFVGSPQARTDRAFIYACCFVSIMVLGVLFVVAGLAVLSIVAPSFWNNGSSARGPAFGTLLALIVPIVGSALIFRTLWSQAADDRTNSSTPAAVDSAFGALG